VLGAEGSASGANLRGNTNVGLPLGNRGDFATVTAKMDFLPSVTVRLGYAANNWLLFVRGGAAWAGDKYSVTGAFLAPPTISKVWTTASAGPGAAVWNGHLRTIGRPGFNMITINWAIAAH
jgi:hypothetical protein